MLQCVCMCVFLNLKKRYLFWFLRLQGKLYWLLVMTFCSVIPVWVELERGTCSCQTWRVPRANGKDDPVGRVASRGANFHRAEGQADQLTQSVITQPVAGQTIEHIFIVVFH